MYKRGLSDDPDVRAHQLEESRKYRSLLDTYGITDTSRRTLCGVRSDGSIVRSAFRLNRRLLLPRLYREWKATNGIEVVS